MHATQQLKFGLVGAGAIAQAYVQAFEQSDSAELAAVADVRWEAARSTAEKAGCEAFLNFSTMCNEVDLDAVVVATPPVTHPELCIELLQRGLPVLCEKPFAVDSTGAREMFDASRTTGTLLTMASKFRNVADIQQAKSLIEAGAIGEVRLVENSFTACVEMSDRWNSDSEISGGGVLIDNGTHSVDIVRYLFGPIDELRVVEGERYQQLGVEDTVYVQARTASGVTATIDLSWSVNKQFPNFLSIFGTRGSVLVGWNESKFRSTGDDDWTVFGAGYDKLAAFRNQIDNFAAAVCNDEPVNVSLQDALASVDVIEAAYASLHENRWQTVRYTHDGLRLFVPAEPQELVLAGSTV